MKQTIYKCIECECVFKGSAIDGLRCPICESQIAPININPSFEDLSKVDSYKELKKNPMINQKSWKEFRESGLLWWINTILHTFGWAIVVEIDDKGDIKNAYPSRVKFRGFDEKTNTEGYIKVSEYLNKESGKILKESKE